MHDAGRVGFVTRGKYSDTEIYDFLDVVTYNNSSYIAKKETTGNVPDEDNEYWQVMVKSFSNSGGGVHVGKSPPEDVSTTWIDTSSGGIYKYYDESSETWKPVKSVWG